MQPGGEFVASVVGFEDSLLIGGEDAGALAFAGVGFRWWRGFADCDNGGLRDWRERRW